MKRLFKTFETFSLYHYAHPRTEEICHIVSLLRPMDLEELKVMYDGNAVNGLRDSIKRSLFVYLIYDKHHRTAGIIGIAYLDDDSDVLFPWFLSTIYFPLVGREFSKWAKNEAKEYTKHATLANYVHKDYKVSVRWLRWLGFKVDETVTYFDDKFYLIQKGKE